MNSTKSLLFEQQHPSIIRLSGAHAERYLHGRITQNVKALQQDRAAESLLLTPQGRVQGHFVIYRDSEGFLLVIDPSSPQGEEEFLQALLQFKVADQVEAISLTGKLSLITLLGEVPTDLNPNAKVFHYSRFTLGNGADLIVERTELSQLTSTLTQKHGYTVGTAEKFELLRIKSRTPLFGVDIDDKTLAPELPLEKMVSFDKGCYAGQEVVEMATARGRPNRTLLLLSFGGENTIRARENVVDRSGKSLGEVTSTAYEAESYTTYALALIKTVGLEGPLYQNGNELTVSS